MNLGEIRYILSQFTDRDIRPEEFNTLLDSAQRAHFLAKQGDDKALRPFKVHRGIDNETPPLFVTNGIATLPTDFHSYLTSFNIVDGEACQAEEVNDDEFDGRRQHSIEIPTLKFPIINLQSDYVRVLPKTVQYLTFEYIKKPDTVHFGYSIAKGYTEYDPSTSVELAWDEPNQIEIIQLALNNLGVQASVDEINKKR